MANCHLVILKKPYLDAILEGRKQIELRLYKIRHRAFERIFAGDKLFLKISSGPVCATATVALVKYFENLTPEKILELKQQYNHYIAGGDEHWQSKIDCKYGFLVWVKNVRKIESVRIHKKDWRAWVILTEKEDFGLLKMGGLK
ncbi:MAG: ASCH domain-containing protein [Planctomycetota bacterium]|jgi:ASC-1-like (ASCH) protein